MPAITVIRMRFSRRIEYCSSSSRSRCCWASCRQRPSARSTTCTCMTPSCRCVMKCASHAWCAACKSCLTSFWQATLRQTCWQVAGCTFCQLALLMLVQAEDAAISSHHQQAFAFPVFFVYGVHVTWHLHDPATAYSWMQKAPTKVYQ